MRFFYWKERRKIMSLLTVTGLSQCFMEKILYDKVSFEIYKEEHVGIVGENGAGKSTLVKILCGEYAPDEGKIEWQKNIKIGYLDQHVEIEGNQSILEYLRSLYKTEYEMELRMNFLYENHEEGDLFKAAKLQEQLIDRGFYEIDVKINKVMNGLGIRAIGENRILKELSGGQRAKVILAKLLLEPLDMLLLDEPTNFLDKEHVEWLATYLNQFSGTFMVVSHDFEFLDKITNCILDVDASKIMKYYGRFSEFQKQKEHRKLEHLRQFESQQKMIEKTEQYIRKNIAGNNSKNAKGRRKQLAHIERIAAPTNLKKYTLSFKECGVLTQQVLVLEDLLVGYQYPLLPKINLKLFANQKIAIQGFNGIGKSTLLKTLMNRIPKLAGNFHFSPQVSIGYYEQDLGWENHQKTPMQIISDAYPKMTIREIRSLLAKGGLDDEQVEQQIYTLSGGEQAKVKLCLLMSQRCNFLILDEVTNHLDMDTKEALKKALKNFQGTIILVCHELSFYKDWINQVIDIEKL